MDLLQVYNSRNFKIKAIIQKHIHKLNKQHLLHHRHPKDTEPRYIGRLRQANSTVFFWASSQLLWLLYRGLLELLIFMKEQIEFFLGNCSTTLHALLLSAGLDRYQFANQQSDQEHVQVLLVIYTKKFHPHSKGRDEVAHVLCHSFLRLIFNSSKFYFPS